MTMEQHHFPQTDPRPTLTAETALFSVCDGEFSVLLTRRDADPYRGTWQLPGATVAVGESLEAAARRALIDAVGAVPPKARFSQLGAYGQPGRDPRSHAVSVVFIGVGNHSPDVTGASRYIDVAGVEAGEVPMAFDHADIVADAAHTLRRRLEDTPLAAHICGDPFTIADLRRIYETVWGVEVDASNFSKKMKATEGLLVATGEARSEGPGRPAALYRLGDARQIYPAIRP